MNNAEMMALGAHHAAHIAHGDAALFVFAGSVVADFDLIKKSLYDLQFNELGRGKRNASATNLPLLLMLGVAWMASLYTRFVFKLVLKGRKIHADASAVAMTRDPLTLAGLLHWASPAALSWPRLPESLMPLLLLPGAGTDMEQHAPLQERLRHLLNDAHAKLRLLQGRLQQRKSERRVAQRKARRYWHWEQGAWAGPFALGALKQRQGFAGDAWVAPEGGKARRALADEDLGAVFKPGKDAKGRCPRCGGGLRPDRREGLGLLYCPLCDGHLVRHELLNRMVLRQEERFSLGTLREALRLRKQEAAQGRGSAEQVCGYPPLRCPACGGQMRKAFFSYMAKVVIDKCVEHACGSVWLDPGELELVQMMSETPDFGLLQRRTGKVKRLI